MLTWNVKINDAIIIVERMVGRCDILYDDGLISKLEYAIRLKVYNEILDNLKDFLET